MVDFNLGNPPTDEARDVVGERFNARLGLVLFATYLVVYGAYVLVNAFWPALMDKVPFAGLNVAIISGLGLIVGAFVLALVYVRLCRSPGKDRP
jgi:uncharacterized membrane protein (DUF485 family)